MTTMERDALSRLIALAQGDTGQSSKVADFLLAWWDADTCGGFNLATLWSLDQAITADMIAVLAGIAKGRSYPDTLGYGAHFHNILRKWRPSLLS